MGLETVSKNPEQSKESIINKKCSIQSKLIYFGPKRYYLNNPRLPDKEPREEKVKNAFFQQRRNKEQEGKFSECPCGEEKTSDPRQGAAPRSDPETPPTRVLENNTVHR